MKKNESINVNLSYAEIETIYQSLVTEMVSFRNMLLCNCHNEEEYYKLRDESVLWQVLCKIGKIKDYSFLYK